MLDVASLHVPRRIESCAERDQTIVAHSQRIRVTGWGLVALAALNSGCKEANPLGRRPIHGVVTYQTRPVEYGGIQFLPSDLERGVGSGAIISSGKYQISEAQGLPPGKYQVRISAPDRGAETKANAPPGDERGLAAERLPAKYNSKTTLEVEVTEDRGSQEVNFDLR